MNEASHVVLGGNGTIGRETIRALVSYGHTPLSVGRRPAVVPGTPSIQADLLDAADTEVALRGADVAYFVPGLPYDSRVWQEQWPVLLNNAIDAALCHGTRLIYFDNVYAYGRATERMTESSASAPASRKGRVRAAALDLLAAAQSRGLHFTIARSADFYGPGAATSVFNTFALDKMARGKRPVWLFDADQPHSLTYTPDIGRGLATLGLADTAPGSVWHLPTAPAMTGREYLQLAGDARPSVMSSATMRFGAVFNAAARETLEMSYQYTAPYVFDSTKFTEAFNVHPTPTEEGVSAALDAALAPIPA